MNQTLHTKWQNHVLHILCILLNFLNACDLEAQMTKPQMIIITHSAHALEINACRLELHGRLAIKS